MKNETEELLEQLVTQAAGELFELSELDDPAKAEAWSRECVEESRKCGLDDGKIGRLLLSFIGIYEKTTLKNHAAALRDRLKEIVVAKP